jgi:SAM-dependent methyltransferase
MKKRRMKLYTSMASWFYLLTPPEEYAEEVGIYLPLLKDPASPRRTTLLELGAGGGNNASHLKKHFTMTLTDISPQMLAMSRKLNPECEHILGDMRSLRLGRTFDAVFIHDAIDYMTTEQDLGAAIATAFVHCKPGAWRSLRLTMCARRSSLRPNMGEAIKARGDCATWRGHTIPTQTTRSAPSSSPVFSGRPMAGCVWFMTGTISGYSHRGLG